MSEIQQSLGFDASAALDSLKQLDAAMATFEGRLKSSAAQFATFNSGAGKVVSALIQISKHGHAAASALSAVSSALATAGPRNQGADAAAAASAVQSTVQALQQSGEAARSASVKVGDAMIRIGRQSTTAANQVKSSTDRMTVSLRLLSRIVFTQAIVRGLSQLRNAFRATVGDAVEFQKKLALIQTIDDSGRSFDTLASQVRSLSDQFNIPLLQVAEGLYQTISNQITGAAESTLFLGQAAEFARATNSSLADSVDLLSGILKSYNLDVSETDRVSAVMFKTIDLGRITATELANAFGRVGPAAADLGIELEEVAGAIAAISVRGTDTAQSLTQFRNIITALTKPSVAMRRALREIGFESGQAAIETLGFTGTIQELVASFNGSSEAMAAAFQNIRGFNGVTAITSDEMLTLSNNINEMRKAADEFTKSKFLQATATDAEKATSELNKLKNAFTVDLGQAFLKLVADIADATGGVDNFTGAIKFAPAAIAGMAVSLIGLAAAFKGAQLAGLGFSRVLGLLTLVPAAIGLGKSIGNFIDQKLFEQNFAGVKATFQKIDEESKKLTEGLAKSSAEANETDQIRVKVVREATRDISASFLEQENAAIKSNEALVRNTKASVTDIVGAYDNLVDAIRGAAAEARDIQRDSAERALSITDRLGDLDFEDQTRNFSDARKVLALNERSAQLAREAANTLASAGGDQDKIARGQALFQQSLRAAEQAKTAAGRTGNFRLEQQARDQIRQSLNDQLKAEKQLQTAQNARIPALNKTLPIAQKITDLVREQTKIISDNTGDRDAEGRLFGSREQGLRDQRRQAAQAQLNQIAKGVNTDALRQLGLGDFVDQFQTQLKQDPIRLGLSIDQGLTDVRGKLTTAMAEFNRQAKITIGIDSSGIEQALGLESGSIQSASGFFSQLSKGVTDSTELRKQLDAAIKAERAVDAARSKSAAAFNKAQSAISSVPFKELLSPTGPNGRFESGEQIHAQGQQAIQALRDVAAAETVTTEQLDAALAQSAAFVEKIRTAGGEVRRTFNESADAVELLKQKVIEQNQARVGVVGQTPSADLQAQLQAIDAINAKIDASPIGEKIKTAVNAAANSSATITTNAEAAGRALTAGAEAYIKAASTPLPSAEGRMHGGLMKAFSKGGFARYLASGGSARGTDTIPAMLSRGEFVVNAKSSRQFFSQLQAINAGVTPTFRGDGGNVTNVSVGDINVHGGRTNQQTGRAIVNEIKREFRRGTSTL